LCSLSRCISLSNKILKKKNDYLLSTSYASYFSKPYVQASVLIAILLVERQTLMKEQIHKYSDPLKYELSTNSNHFFSTFFSSKFFPIFIGSYSLILLILTVVNHALKSIWFTYSFKALHLLKWKGQGNA